METALRGLVAALTSVFSGCVLASCASSVPGTVPLAVEPALQTPMVVSAPSSENPQDTRDRNILRALSLPKPTAVEGMRITGTGSGFFIAGDRVLTNFHVVGGCRGLTVGNNTEGEEVEANLVASDPQADLAVLSAQVKDIQPAHFLVKPFMESREDLAIVGYPEHGLPVLQAELDRVAVFEDDLETYGRLYRFFGPVRRGNSGGPVLDASGAVVGVVTAKVDTVAVYKKTGAVVDDVGYAISNRTVFGFLARNRIAVEAATAEVNLSEGDLLNKAHGFVRQVRCWK